MDRIRLSRALFICLLLSAITFAVYWPVRHHRFTNFDDDTYVSENPHVYYGLTSKNVACAFHTYHGSNWHPLTWLSHMLDCQLYDLNPMGHHLTNVGLHILNTVVLLLLLRRLSLTLWPSAFVAAVFALHPLHVESVAWVSERKDVLSTLFFLLTIWAYVERIKSSSPNAVPEAGASRRFMLRAIAWYLLALL